MLIYSESAEPRSQIKSLSITDKILLILKGIENPKPKIRKTPEDYNLPYKTEVIVKDDLKLSAWVILQNPNPNNKFAIFFHGAMATKDQLLLEAKEIYSLGYNIVLVDFRGSGDSNNNYTTIGYLEAEDVKLTIDHINTTYSPSELVLYGCSLGASAIFRAVSKLEVNANKIIVEAIYDNLKQAIKNRFALMNIPSLFFPDLMIFWGNILFPIDGTKMNPEEFAKDISIPILFFHGSDDQRAKLEEGKKVFQNLKTKNKKFVTFEGLKHEAYLPKQSEKWRSAIYEFLGE